MVSGPAGGTVTFGNASSASTTAAFSPDGAYRLRFTGTDALLTASDEMAIDVGGNPLPGVGVIYRETFGANGTVLLNSAGIGWQRSSATSAAAAWISTLLCIEASLRMTM